MRLKSPHTKKKNLESLILNNQMLNDEIKKKSKAKKIKKTKTKFNINIK